MSNENNQPINDTSQRIDSLIEMYRIQIERWNKRRDIEWRLALTFWSGIVVITGFLAGKIQLPWWTVFIYLTALICYVRLWLYGLWSANDGDKREADNYKSKIDTKLCFKNVCNYDRHSGAKQEKENKFWKDWSMRAQIFFTIIIFSASWYALYKIPKSEPIFAAFIAEVQKFLKAQ